MSLVALLLSLIELILDRMFLYLISVVTFLSFIFMLAGTSVYTNYAQGDKLEMFAFGWTFVLAWITVLISLGTSVLTFFVEHHLLGEDERPAGGFVFGWKPVSGDSDSYTF